MRFVFVVLLVFEISLVIYAYAPFQHRHLPAIMCKP